MAKAKRMYGCTECGATAPKWAGQCAECGAWNTLVETVAQISLKDLSPEVQGLLEGERKHREKLERELADQKKASAEAKRLQEEALKSEQKRIAIENLTGALCEAKPGLPKTAAKLLARTMIEDGQVKIDGGRARWLALLLVVGAARDLGVPGPEALGLLGLIGLGTIAGRFGLAALASAVRYALRPETKLRELMKS